MEVCEDHFKLIVHFKVHSMAELMKTYGDVINVVSLFPMQTITFDECSFNLFLSLSIVCIKFEL